MIPYIGNAAYCYANATAMLLATIGENISPSRIEVLTGVGLCTFWLEDDKLIFFNNLVTLPDAGISKALEILGFDYTEKSSHEAEPALFEELRVALAQSPAILGPLDMGYLRYIPFHRELVGEDHFVLAYGMDEQEVHLHDPEGYPHVSLPLEQLALAWKAERISYRRGFYRYWTSPKRIHHPTEEELYDEALQCYKSIYHETDEVAVRKNRIIGRDAILACADHVRSGKISPPEVGHMVYFAFKLGAKRALDFATLFDFRDTDLAALKRRQAELFGRCHTLAAAKNWSSLADTLQQLADVEEEFRVTLLAR